MAQSTDLVVPNTSGAGVRSGINTRLQAIATHQSGATAPATTYAYQLWADTTAGLLKQRDGSNANWITVGTLGAANLGHAPLASPTFTGTVTIPAGASISGFAPTASPNFTGTPAAPTAAVGTSTTQLATTAFVAANKLVAMTAQNSTSGTSIDFTDIPSWVKRVTVMLNGVSTSGASLLITQLGTSSGFSVSGYNGTSCDFNLTGANGVAFANVNGIRCRSFATSTDAWRGVLVLTNFATNTWVTSGSFENGVASGIGTSSISFLHTLAGALDRIRITTVNGTDTFDAGSINVMYE